MNIIGIVCEYNPFHNGHEYHIKCTKAALGENAPVVCVMSGDFVQRGEPAMYAKHARAQAACRSGVDLVIELPLPWSLSSAEGFARGAVGLLARLGATHLSFGSEAGELEPLELIAQSLIEPGLISDTKELMSKEANLSFPAARSRALAQRLGEVSQQLELPNNILAVEYLKAIYELRLELIPITIQRFGSGHDMNGDSGPKSASEIRRMIALGKNVQEHIPTSAEAVYRSQRERGRELADKSAFELAMLSRLRMFDEDYYNCLPDAADGLGTRLFRAAREEASLDAVLAAAKTKRYALSRIRRMCLCACLGVKNGMNSQLPPYARVLAANSRGCELLRDLDRKGDIPVITKPAAVRQLSAECVQLFSLGASAHDFYTLGFRASGERKGGQDWRNSPIIVKD